MSIRDLLYELETVETGGGDGGVGTIEGSEVAGQQPAAVDGGLGIDDEGTPPVEAVEPTALTRDELAGLINDGVSSSFDSLVERMEHDERVRAAQQAEQQQRAAAPELPEWDPFNPAVVQQHMMAAIKPAFEQMIERFAPALEVAGDYRNSQGEKEANTVLDSLAQELGNTDFNRDHVVQRAALLMNSQNMDPEEALRAAAEQQIKWEQQLEERGAEKFRKQAQNLADGGEQLAGGNGAAGEVVEHRRGPQAYTDQLNRSLVAMGRRPGVGSPTG